MKRFLFHIFPFLIIAFVCLSTPVKSKSIGEGDLYLDDGTIKYLQQYINGKYGFPAAFLISIDGSYSIYWSCQGGSNNCTGGNIKNWVKQCSKKANIQCKIFAKSRFIKWKNGINPGKGKVSKIKKK